ncbi:cleavage and polyadenylation specificity factor [Reticulomyxa filosa]|uniref:Cleavage and polyadenylation specificity factor n=1 Tax=Reticulomyxa filosa TaxID=46433 RepID=X6NZP1_RETFI|nr:cleavage and polyadenylation specificity factor [Reticulomyxa filosa]|eukprot:ETO31348.1 cleavage and polyadenylation specificity factor [Reticulomyxa filosa]
MESLACDYLPHKLQPSFGNNNLKSSHDVEDVSRSSNEPEPWLKTNLVTQPIYNKQEIRNAVEKVTKISMNQVLQINPDLKIQSIASGLFIGSCNWHITIGNTKVAVVSGSSGSQYRHPLPLNLNALANAGVDYLIIDDLQFLQPGGEDKKTTAAQSLALVEKTLYKNLFALFFVRINFFFFELVDKWKPCRMEAM